MFLLEQFSGTTVISRADEFGVKARYTRTQRNDPPLKQGLTPLYKWI
jgi:hypothetical protein